MSNLENYRNRSHMLMLYSDNAEHYEALQKIEKSYDYAMILHDKDTWTAEDELKNPENKAGTYKKPHYHVILRFQQAKWRTALAKELNITENFIQEVKKFDNALQYLIHYNDTNKAQYTVDEVRGNLKQRLIETINKLEKSEGEKVCDLLDFIDSYDEYISIKAFARYCAMNGYWAEFRRSGAIFMKVIEEHNKKYFKE